MVFFLLLKSFRKMRQLRIAKQLSLTESYKKKKKLELEKINILYLEI